LEFEIENECLHRVIFAVRQTNPDIPALEALRIARQDSGIRGSVEVRYQSVFDLIENDDWAEAMSHLPPSKYQH
jgi:hypothetical protein